MTIRSLLVTGAAGGIGRTLRTSLKGRYPLIRWSDVVAMAPAGPGEECVTADLSDAGAMIDLCAGMDAILHLGGQSTEAAWPVVQAANIQGLINLYEAARLAGTKRVLFASSNHAVGLWRRSNLIDHTAPARPDGRYGLSKAFGEDLSQLYAYKHGIAGFCMRIGSCFEKPANQRMLSTWLSFADFTRLAIVGLEADYTYEIVYGVSRNTRSWWDNANAYRLGYDPQDNAEVFAADVEHIIGAVPMDEDFQGGGFVSPDFTGDPARIPA